MSGASKRGWTTWDVGMVTCDRYFVFCQQGHQLVFSDVVHGLRIRFIGEHESLSTYNTRMDRSDS